MEKIISVLLLAVLVSCGRFEPREGDLLFVTGDSSSEFSEAITDATAHGCGLKYDHVAIVAADGDNLSVIEASSRNGVVETGWDDFMEQSRFDDGRYGIVVMRLNADFDVKKAIATARSHVGEEYDWSFLPDNGRMYCSELVYESYRDKEDRHLFDASPMSFRDADGNMPQFWIDLFDRLGEKVPEGVNGTNPTDMSRSKKLTEVHRYF